MPKPTDKRSPDDEMFSAGRWLVKKIPDQQPVVRSGRIKKAKTIFDPSDTNHIAQPRSQEREPEKKPVLEKHPLPAPTRINTRRQSIAVISNGSHLAARIQPTPPLSPQTKKRTSDVLIPTTRPEELRVPPGVTIRSHRNPPAADQKQNNSTASRVSLLKSSQAKETPAKEEQIKRESSVSNGSSGAIKANKKLPLQANNSVPQRKPVTYQCCVCLQLDPREGVEWTKCTSCLVNAHQECSLQSKVRGPWLCQKCIICNECEEELEVDREAVCSKCYTMYHIDCVGNDHPRPKPGATTWLCEFCLRASRNAAGLQKKRKTVVPPMKAVDVEEELAKNPKEQQQKPNSRGKSESKSENQRRPSYFDSLSVDPVPDASTWTADEVVKYFSKWFPEEAHVFKEQEIDGVSLLLLRRTDVIRGLGFKLGPAIKIYKHILMLQTRNNDPTLTWF